MRKFNDLKIRTRINLFTGSMAFIIFLSMAMFNYFSGRNERYSTLDQMMRDELGNLHNYLELEVAKNRELVKADMNSFEHYWNSMGALSVNDKEQITIEVTDQTTNHSIQANLSVWKIGGQTIQFNTSVIDYIIGTGVQSATIFQRIRWSQDILVAGHRHCIRRSSSLNRKRLSWKGNNFNVLNHYKLFFIRPSCRNALVVREKDCLFLFRKYLKQAIILVEVMGVPSTPFKRVFREKAFQVEWFRSIWERQEKFQYFSYVGDIEAYVVATINKKDVIADLIKILVFSLTASGFGLVVFLLLNLFLSKNITKGLTQGVRFAKQVASGNLNTLVEVKQDDEVGELAEALNRMVVKLREVLTGIRMGAANVAAASIEMSGTSEMLSGRRVGELSAMEDLMIRSNADNARQRNKSHKLCQYRK